MERENKMVSEGDKSMGRLTPWGVPCEVQAVADMYYQSREELPPAFTEKEMDEAGIARGFYFNQEGRR